MKQTKQKGRADEAQVPFRMPRLVFTARPGKVKDMLNLGIIEERHLQPRDELARLRRTAPFHPQPAGNSQNEQRARAELHARNEASIGDHADGAANDPDETSTDGCMETHWTRIFHQDVLAYDRSALAGGIDARNLLGRALQAVLARMTAPR